MRLPGILLAAVLALGASGCIIEEDGGNYDVGWSIWAGRVVRTLANGQQQPGSYSVAWNGRDQVGRSLANGIYFCKFSAGDCRATEKLVLKR